MQSGTQSISLSSDRPRDIGLLVRLGNEAALIAPDHFTQAGPRLRGDTFKRPAKEV